MTQKREGGQHYPVYGATPTPNSVTRGMLNEDGVSPDGRPGWYTGPRNRRRPLTVAKAKPEIELPARVFRSNAVPIKPVEIFIPPEDTPELQEQIIQLKEYALGQITVAELLREPLADETRRSLLIHRVGEELRSSGLSEDLLLASAQRMADLTAPESPIQ